MILKFLKNLYQLILEPLEYKNSKINYDNLPTHINNPQLNNVFIPTIETTFNEVCLELKNGKSVNFNIDNFQKMLDRVEYQIIDDYLYRIINYNNFCDMEKYSFFELEKFFNFTKEQYLKEKERLEKLDSISHVKNLEKYL